MARSRRTPEEIARRERAKSLMKVAQRQGYGRHSGFIQILCRCRTGGRSCSGSSDEELGYSKYDYRNKETDNSRNGHSSKTMKTSFGDMDSS